MGAPILIPAAIGAVGSAAMGKSPITGALMGGALGGFGSASGLFGAGATGAGATQAAGAAAPSSLFGATEAISPFTPTGVLGTQTMNSALTGMQPALGMAGEQFVAQNAPMFAGQGGMFDVAGTQNQILGGIGQQTAMGGGGFDPSLMGSVQRGLESGYGSLSDWAKANPMQALNTTGQVVQAVSPQEQQQQVGQPAIPPVTRGTYNTAPTLGQGQNERVASRMQVTPNQLNLYPSFYRGGF